MKKNKILIVDDLALNRILLSEIIEELGVDYDMAKNGKDALEKICKQEYKAVLMDIEMPVMNGFEATRYIRQKCPAPTKDITVIAISAHTPVSFLKDYKDIGFDALLAKPYSLGKIQKMLEKYDIIPEP